jgi:serine/threonine-protein kinase
VHEDTARPTGVDPNATTLAPDQRPQPHRGDADATLPVSVAASESAALERISIRGYEILGELGRGGMGVVYRARQVSLKRIVALKMILSSAHAGPEERARFVSEAEAVARLQHPNIVQIHEIGEADGCPYFSLEFVDGGTLAHQLNGRPLPPREAAELVETLARAMHAVHQLGIIHRDLKPANVLLTADGTPKITDFGLAKAVECEASGTGPSALRALTQSGMILGTPSYMAPEQAEGKGRAIGPATDVYALGAILYEMLTGRPPFDGGTLLDTVMQVLSEEPLPPRRRHPGVPRDLETICLKCLAKEPRQRYASARDLADDLQRYLTGEPILARPQGKAGRLLRWASRQPALAATLLAVAVYYLYHLFCLLVLQVEDLGGHFHWFVTGLAIVWSLGAAFFQWLIRRPGWEELATFGWAGMDVLLFTVLLFHGHGPRSALLGVYMLLVGGAALRFRTDLVWYVTGTCMASYLGLAIHASYFRTDVAVEPYVTIIFLFNLGIMGLIFHLLLRRVRTSSGSPPPATREVRAANPRSTMPRRN